MIKKIAFLGNFNVPYTTESHHLWTYRKLGYEVVTLQEGKINADEILKIALESDLFVWTHTHGWDTPGMDVVLNTLKKVRIPTMGYHLDLWLGIERQKNLETDPYWGIEHFFTVDPQFVPVLEAKGIKAHYVMAGVVENECYLGTPRDKYKHDVVFVGSKGYHKEWPYRARLIEFLQETYGDRFGHYGNDGIGKAQIRGKELNDLYASAKVVVGDTLCPAFNYPDYFSDRVFETTGRGGFLIFPYIKGIKEHFEVASSLDLLGQVDENTELITYEFGNFSLLKGLIDLFISPLAENGREIMRKNAHARTKKDHTYTNRLKQILNIIEDENA